MDVARAKSTSLPPAPESDAEAPKAKPKKAERRSDATAAVKAHRKRPRIVFSDDDSESDAPAPASVPALAPAPSQAPRKTERKRDRPRKPRAKERAAAESDAEVENEPVRRPAAAVDKDKAHARAKARPGASSAPRSATNIVRPELVAAPDQDGDGACAVSKPAPDTAPQQKLAAREGSVAPEAATADASQFDLPLAADELEGMLIETLATARASSLATSALYGALMAARPALHEMPLPVRRGQRLDAERERELEKEKEGEGRRGAKAKADAASRRAWVPALEEVLEAGWRRCGVFGKVVNSGTVSLSSSRAIRPPLPFPPLLSWAIPCRQHSRFIPIALSHAHADLGFPGQDLADHALALEARWFYDPDRDEDADRAALVRSMMRRPGKRSETKKAKQYYWRPLPKISRWDAEDEL